MFRGLLTHWFNEGWTGHPFCGNPSWIGGYHADCGRSDRGDMSVAAAAMALST
jgi:hypothetical protein